MYCLGLIHSQDQQYIPLAMIRTKQEQQNAYKEEVLGRHVVIHFFDEEDKKVKPYLGQIQQMNVTLQDDLSLKYEHYVLFDDGDKIWFDLVEEEEEDRLSWVPASSGSSRRNGASSQPPAQKRQRTTRASTAQVNNNRGMDPPVTVTVSSEEATADDDEDSEASLKAACESILQSTEKINALHRQPPEPARRNSPRIPRRQRAEAGSLEDRQINTRNLDLNEDRLNGMFRWMTEVPHGQFNKTTSVWNATDVMRRVRLLAQRPTVAITEEKASALTRGCFPAVFPPETLARAVAMGWRSSCSGVRGAGEERAEEVAAPLDQPDEVEPVPEPLLGAVAP